jgi:hypothetical protein
MNGAAPGPAGDPPGGPLAGGRPADLLFCRGCGGSIARRDFLAGRALLLEGRAFCPRCAPAAVGRRETLRAVVLAGGILAAGLLGTAAWTGIRVGIDARDDARAAAGRAAAAEAAAAQQSRRLAALEGEARGLAALVEAEGRAIEGLKKDLSSSQGGLDDRLDGVERSLATLLEAVDGLRREVAAARGPAQPLTAAEEKELLARLDSVDAGARFEALWRLQRGRGESARAAAVKGLSDPQESVRYQAAALARTLAAKEAVPALVERLSDASAAVRAAAGEALRGITGQDLGFDPLEPDPGKRGEAVQRWKEWLAGR